MLRFLLRKKLETFHLPGEHDQQSHAGEGITSEAEESRSYSKSDVRAVKSLALKWKRSEHGIDLTDAERESLSKFRLRKPTPLYRGMDWKGELPEPGSVIEIEQGEKSWSASRATGEMFMVSNGSIPYLRDIGMRRYAASWGEGTNAVVLERVFEPSETLFDFDEFGNAADSHNIDPSNFPGFGMEGEVVSRSGKIKARVVSTLDGRGRLRRADDFTMDDDEKRFEWQPSNPYKQQ